MKLCLFAGARAVMRSAIVLFFEAESPLFGVGRGKAVMVCEVDVIEDVVLLVFAMTWAAILLVEDVERKDFLFWRR